MARREFFPDRLQAIERFIRSIHRQHFPTRLTAAQRRRLGHMLRCPVARKSRHPILKLQPPCSVGDWSAPRRWSDSAFRYQTHRLVRDSLNMVERGYRQLLCARRRYL
ncbi:MULTISPECIES: DNA -binding domain-containing protein [Mesorhizobium]|uniref:T6SS Transcription factor RovC-like DNA binding domain-containing protein n=1 Tax=Mesorhizobium plurifarium TaxID=69974 RepID=A0A090GT22_MESPL|nr:conserved hypothetical protein [Mesorhizobium plurifarium]